MSHFCHHDSKIKGFKGIIQDDTGALTGPSRKFKSSPKKRLGLGFLTIQSSSGESRLTAIALATVWGSRGNRSMVHRFDTLADGGPGYKTNLNFLTDKEATRKRWLCTLPLRRFSRFAIIFTSGQYQNAILLLFTPPGHSLGGVATASLALRGLETEHVSTLQAWHFEPEFIFESFCPL